MTYSTETHRQFLSYLKHSEEGVERVADWLRSRGVRVTVNHNPPTPSHDQWREYSDHGDLLAMTPHGERRIEAKRLRINFSGPGDWPFGNRFIVCTKHSFDAAEPKPYAYVILSNDMEHAGVVRPDHSSHRWTVKRVRDGRYKTEVVEQDMYLCPIDAVRWMVVP